MVKTDFYYPKRKWYMQSMIFIFALTFLSFTEATAQALACNDNVQVSLNLDCEADITPAMILEGEDESLLPNYVVTISGVSGTVVTSPGTYSVTVTDITNDNSCWGNITVEDKLAPIVEDCDCPVGNTLPECEFLCTDLDAILANTAVAVPQPVVDENCGSYTSEYSDVVSEGGCGEKIIIRSWLFTDDAGNTSNGCTQQFKTVPVESADIVAPVSPMELPCGADVSMPAIVDYFTPLVGADVAITHGYPTANGVALNGAICNLVTSKVDLVIPVCDQSCSNSFKIIRDWTILDWCTAEVTSFNQIIKAVDQEDPTITANDQTVSTDPWVCQGNFYLQAPAYLHDNCTDYVTYTVTGPAGVVITWDAQANLYFATGAPKGNHTFLYTASDCCGNTATDPVIITVVDQTAPVAVAKQNIVISLTQSANADGSAKIYAPSIDNGSHDGCTDVHLEIRRDQDECGVTGNATYNNDGHTFDSSTDPDNGQWVKFCCDDLTNAVVDVDGDGENDPGYVMVWLRVWDDGDMNGTFGSSGDNFNETWAYVKVEDKLNPIINCPADITIACDDDADDLDLTGSATGSMTCGPADVTYTDIINNVDNCGVGFITRRWSIDGNATVFCDQRITKSAGDLFDGNISWPADFNTDCTDLDSDNVPTWLDNTCSQLGYSLESDTFQFEDGACFKILNHWTVIDWCQYDPNSTFPVGIWEHIQVIKVLDDEAPVMTCADQMFAVDDHTDADNDGNQCETISLMLTNTADDNGDCASEWLKWTVLVDIWGDGTYDYEYSSHLPTFDSNFNDTNGNGIPDIYLAPTSSGEEVKVTLPDDIQGSMSNHKVKWTVSDGCLNNTTCNNTFMVVDKKAPTPYCIDISTALMESGMVELWACDFDLGSFDNCTTEENLRFTFTDTKPQNDPNFNSAQGCSAKIFDCDDLAQSPVGVQMYVWDEKDNYDYCEVLLTLIDNQGGCDVGAGMRISGQVMSVNQDVVENTEVTLVAPALDMIKYDMTNENGGYAFVNNPDQANYNITAKLEGNYLDGVSTLDLVKIQRHVLGLDAFEDAYKVIASDINADEKISASDLLQLRKLILGVYTELPNSDSYVVIDANQEFTNVSEPWPLTYELEINPLVNDMSDQNFVAIKVGDVSDNANYGLLSEEGVATRSNKSLNMIVENTMIVKGENQSIDFVLSQDQDVSGLQLSLNMKGMKNVNVVSHSIAINESNYALIGDQLNISWTAGSLVKLKKNDILFSIEGLGVKNIETSEAIAVNNESGIAPEAYTQDLEVLELNMVTRELEAVTEEFVVYQNEPNPFEANTIIGYTLAQSGTVNLSIADVTGKVVLNRSNNASKGAGQFVINSSDLSGSGLYYYSVTANDKTVTNKMILIK